ncbi:MAG: PHP domain-containing protein [Caldilineaceae bacterium]|nr:PHP domain-containing protein [Caldilineaceae bacterium]
MPDHAQTYPVDLQVHSTCSDGTDTPARLVEKAAAQGVRVLALTDHDNISGVAEATAAGARHGVAIVPALEFSTQADPQQDFLDINILGYGVDPADETLRTTLARIVESRIEQKIRQVERLQTYGVDAPVDEVLAAAKGVPGRVHIAQVALQRNPEKFADIDDVFRQYLAADAPCSTYVQRSFSLTVFDAIELTHAAGGAAVLAHPGSYVRVQHVEAMIARLADAGLDGLEVRYTYGQNRGYKGASPQVVAKVIAHFDALADRLGLYKTGGSDYHGATKPGIRPGQAGLTTAEWRRLNDALNLLPQDK